MAPTAGCRGPRLCACVFRRRHARDGVQTRIRLLGSTDFAALRGPVASGPGRPEAADASFTQEFANSGAADS
jgi:hypothetical protein